MENEKGKINKKFNIVIYIICISLIVIGLLMFFYPLISNFLAEKNHMDLIRNYEETVETLSEEQIAEEFEKARIYNENLAGDPVHDPFLEGSGYAIPENYIEVLNINNDGIMGYIKIPKINVNLPIYHGTEEDVMEKGAGHIEITSLPIGGTSTHSVLTGHTGLPSAKLFTRLDELEVDDIFYINVLNETLTYKVYEIKVILPEEIDELEIEKGRDLITLVTCTPYGVNTHRLLVKAERTEYEEYVEENSSISEVISNSDNFVVVIIVILMIILIIIIIVYKIKISKKH